jgi:hypothetical protein
MARAAEVGASSPVSSRCASSTAWDRWASHSVPSSGVGPGEPTAVSVLAVTISEANLRTKSIPLPNPEAPP